MGPAMAALALLEPWPRRCGTCGAILYSGGYASKHEGRHRKTLETSRKPARRIRMTPSRRRSLVVVRLANSGRLPLPTGRGPEQAGSRRWCPSSGEIRRILVNGCGREYIRKVLADLRQARLVEVVGPRGRTKWHRLTRVGAELADRIIEEEEHRREAWAFLHDGLRDDDRRVRVHHDRRD